MLLHQLAADAKFAVRTFVGLTVRITLGDQLSNLTVFEDGSAFEDIGASLLIPMQATADRSRADTAIDLVLHASAAGAFTDLAADLAWLSGQELAEFALDQHLVVVARDEVDGLFARSLINQAIGVLIARGYTPEQAEGAAHQGRSRRRASPRCRPTEPHWRWRYRTRRFLGNRLLIIRRV
jgi:hypothetical protein